LDIEQKIELLKKKEVRWIDYNIFLLDAQLKNYKNPFNPVVVILFSLLFGVFYALISNKIKSYIGIKKKNK